MAKSADPKPKTRRIMVRVTEEEYLLIYSKSMRWADGNVSEFLRQAGKSWKAPTDSRELDESGAVASPPN